MIESTQVMGDRVHWWGKMSPSFCLTNPIMYMSSKEQLFNKRPDLIVDSNLDVSLVGGEIYAMLGHAAGWTIILIIIEAGGFRWLDKLVTILPKNRIPPKDDIVLDEDVTEEEKRVTATLNLPVRIMNFRKIYPSVFRKPVVAVERASFGLDYGECFALLGVNGAGKTTTFRALTLGQGSTGTIMVAGRDVNKDFNQVCRLIGYCPQYDDGLVDLMTVEEHLHYYARIKDIPGNVRQAIVDRQIQELNLSSHRDKLATTLSGGNKRKLSVALALLGNPPIVLLDEPSAGMDPKARRFLWTVVSKISQSEARKAAVILTTHSMEEAEALSTKMGIMVRGGYFKCLGSSQHLKNKYGKGFEIELRIRASTDSELRELSLSYGYKSGETTSLQIDEIPQRMREKREEEFLIENFKAAKESLARDLKQEAVG
jgi:ATP-binding cassette subfamily A (ABC1) protein 3